MSDLASALMIAIRVHGDQRDKLGVPYLWHVLRVVEAVGDEAKVVAALHDVMEDGSDEGYRAVLALDLPERDRVALALLTRDRARSYAAYIAAIHTRPADDIAREVKLADLKDNLGRTPPEPRDVCYRCKGRGVLNPGGGKGCGYCDSTGHGHTRRAWTRDWDSLRARYENAIQTLEGPSGLLSSHHDTGGTIANG
jgi:hypothetical protein